MKTILRQSEGQAFLLTVIFLAISLTVTTTTLYAQGTGNHLTMYLNSCSNPTPTTIQFDVFAVSDGAANSDLRANAFQFGINFNTGILQPGASITESYISGSADSNMPQQSWCFPDGKYKDHLRAVQQIAGLPNTGKKMVVGTPYRIGTFVLTSTATWIQNVVPVLSLQDPVVIGKTVSEGLLWIGTASSTTSLYVTGTTDSTRSIGSSCSVVLGSGNLSAAGSHIEIYPNPSGGTINISLDKFLNDGVISIYDVLGAKVYSDAFSSKQKTVNCKLSAGVYYVEVKNDERHYTQKIVVQ